MLRINSTFWKSLSIALAVGAGIAWASAAHAACTPDKGVIEARLGVSVGADKRNDAELDRLERRAMELARCNSRLEHPEEGEQVSVIIRISKSTGDVESLVGVVESAVLRDRRNENPDLKSVVINPDHEHYLLARRALDEVNRSPHEGYAIPMTPALGELASRVVPVATVLKNRWPEPIRARLEVRAK